MVEAEKMDEQTVRVLIADDEPQVRSALQFVLEQEPGIAVVGEAGDAAEALVLAAARRPDLALLDWELPGQNGTSALAGLLAVEPGMKVIVLSGRPDVQWEALATGAAAFVCKVEPPERLLAAMKDCLEVKEVKDED